MTTEKENNEEIDLIELFQKISSKIKSALNTITIFLYHIFLFFVRKSVLIAIIIAISIIGGVIKYKTTPRYYSSHLEAYTNTLSSIEIINYVNNLHKLIEEENKSDVSDKLKLSEKELKNIKDIQAFKIVDKNGDGITDEIDYENEYTSGDSTISRSRFVIKVEAYNKNSFQKIQPRIIDYIKQNNYINEINVVRIRQVKEMIAQMNQEIELLDSLKKEEYFSHKGELEPQKGQLLIMNQKETKLYHNEQIKLFKQKQKLDKELEIRQDPITITQDFSALTFTENTLVYYLKHYGIIGLLIGIFLSLTIETKSLIFKTIKNAKRTNLYRI